MFRSVYGEKADSVQGLLDSVYPDMGILFFFTFPTLRTKEFRDQGGFQKQLAMAWYMAIPILFRCWKHRMS